jgi:hypothetical protein
MRIQSQVIPATRLLAAAIVVALTTGAGQRTAAEAQNDSLRDLLQRAGKYIAGYESEVSAIVADENYLQRFIVEPSTEVRHLRSDFLTIRDEAVGWIGFRDVYEVDGRAVRDRTDRLAKLFIEPHPDSRSQANRIAEESARFNIAGQVPRTINTPLLALQFVRSENQGRSTFTDAGRKISRGSEVRMVDFQERATPRIIWTVDGAAARGRFWIEPESGRITETELFVNTALDTGPRRRVVSARIHVAYAEEQQLHLSMPVSMDETYQGVGLIDGHATYSNLRRFNVTTKETIKAP